jgi:hypothetical protein
MTFEITPFHIKLLGELNWTWDGSSYDGGPAVDTKRPFGNKYCVYDMYEIDTGKKWDGYDMPSELQQRYQTIYHELETVIKIILCLKTFQPGKYKKTGDAWSRRGWERIPE